MKKLVILVLSLVCASQSVVATELIYSASDLALIQCAFDLVEKGCAPEDVVIVLEEQAQQKKRSFLTDAQLHLVGQLSVGAFIFIMGYIASWAKAHKRHGGWNRDCFMEGLKCHCTQKLFNHLADCCGWHHSIRFDVDAQNQAASGTEMHDLTPPDVPTRMHLPSANAEDKV